MSGNAVLMILYLDILNMDNGYFPFFFFQAEDGIRDYKVTIRDYKVTGVQTCALPISLACSSGLPVSDPDPSSHDPLRVVWRSPADPLAEAPASDTGSPDEQARVAERLFEFLDGRAVDRKSVV